MFFKALPKIKYPVPTSDGKIKGKIVTDIFTHILIHIFTHIFRSQSVSD